MAKKKEIVWAPLLEITSKKPPFQVRFSPKQRLNLIKNSRKGTNLGDIQDNVRKYNDESWRHHAELRRITRNQARKRKLMNDQKFISGTFIHISPKSYTRHTGFFK